MKYLSLVLIVLCGCTTNFSYHEDTDEEADAVEESETDGIEADSIEETDTAEADPCTGLTQWFLDQDNDGYGQDAAWVCAETAPSGYVANNGDCCDENDAIHPDQEEWFTEPYVCIYTSWDYDCNGILERIVSDNENVAEYGECLTRTTQDACEQPSGWIDAIPACGETGQYWICTWSTSGCQGASAFEGVLGCH